MDIVKSLVNLLNADLSELVDLSVGDEWLGWEVEHVGRTKDKEYEDCEDYILHNDGIYVRCRVYGADYDDDFRVTYKLVNKVEEEVIVTKYQYK